MGSDEFVPPSFKASLEELSSKVLDQRRAETKFKMDLGSIYGKTSPTQIVDLMEYQLTGFHFETDYDRKSISSQGKLKLFYCVEWYVARTECKTQGIRCPYNLFWYEPITAFTTEIGNDVQRVFLAYRPLLDLDCNPTNYIFIYCMYTMCNSPYFAVVLFNRLNGQVEVRTKDNG